MNQQQLTRGDDGVGRMTVDEDTDQASIEIARAIYVIRPGIETERWSVSYRTLKNPTRSTGPGNIQRACNLPSWTAATVNTLPRMS